ncbi:unnamed protein product [Schistosoma rodhaini]|uniref:Uncharacterized protein n=1 Tax=Schistosoma rodhaini TaxID=6188 RepID=A0AA85G110_9TREM|nr:unnamed protein product [Schistosoma rodhaini]
MDDDELTQEILDQFDLICTQHQYDHVSAYSGENLNKHNLHSNKLSNCLSRSTSLDTKLGGCTQTSDFPPNDQTSTVGRNELERLKKEVSVLREELYMKLGELATIKESASRTKATDSDTISKLESHLKSERNDFQRKLSELNAQIAFREADYRLVCSELARMKEEVAFNKQVVNERSVEYSPASQILVSLTSPNPDPVSNHKLRTPVPRVPSTDFHLPAPVTPIPSKRYKVPPAGRMWDVDVTNNLNDKLKSNTTPQDIDKNVVLIDSDEILLSNASRKRQRCVVSPDTSPEHSMRRIPVSLADASVETTDLLHTTSHSHPLSYRIPSCAFSTTEPFNEFTKENPEMLSELLDLSISIPRNDKSRSSININPQTALVTSSFARSEDSTWLLSDYYLTGLSKLLPRQSDILSGIQSSSDNYVSQLNLVVKRFSESVPYLIRRIEEQLKACIRVLLDPYNRYVKQPIQSCHYLDFQKVEAENMETAEKENEQPLSMDVSDDATSHEISYLGEDPFAGAPASQIVTSLTYPSQMKSISKQMGENSILMKGNKSCPSDLGYWFSTNPIVSDNKIINNNNNSADKINSCPSLYPEIMISRSIQGINQLKYLATTINSYCPISFEMFDGINPDFTMDNDELLCIAKEFQNLIRTISGVLSRFINELIDVFFQMEEGKNPISSLSTTTLIQNELIGDSATNVTCSIDHSSFKQSQYTSSKRKSSISSFCIIVPLIVKCLNLASVFAVFIKTDTNPLKNKVSDPAVNATNFSELNTCFPQLLNCIILTSEACFGQNDESTDITTTTKNHCGSFLHTGITNFIKNRSVVTLKPLISFLRLWRQMIIQKHWPGGHCYDQWWDLDDQKFNSIISKDVRQQYIEKLFGTSIKCGLLSLCSWVCQIVNQFNDSTFLSNSLIYNNIEFNHSAEIQRINLLNEFSGMIAVLTQREDIIWPDNCYCKRQVYSTLVHLTTYPLQTLLTIPTSLLSSSSSSHYQSTFTYHALLVKQKYCLLAFGQLTRALIGLLWRHGDQSFQLYTDCLPDYFCLITNLSRWFQYSNRIQLVGSNNNNNYQHELNKLNYSNNFILRPELIEELYDFESGLETSSNSNVF